MFLFTVRSSRRQRPPAPIHQPAPEAERENRAGPPSHPPPLPWARPLPSSSARWWCVGRAGQSRAQGPQPGLPLSQPLPPAPSLSFPGCKDGTALVNWQNPFRPCAAQEPRKGGTGRSFLTSTCHFDSRGKPDLTGEQTEGRPQSHPRPQWGPHTAGDGQRLACGSACQGPSAHGAAGLPGVDRGPTEKPPTEPFLQAGWPCPRQAGRPPSLRGAQLRTRGALAGWAGPSPSAAHALCPRLLCRARRTHRRERGAWPLLAAGHPTPGRRAHFYAPSVLPNLATLAFGGHGIRTRECTAPRTRRIN